MKRVSYHERRNISDTRKTMGQYVIAAISCFAIAASSLVALASTLEISAQGRALEKMYDSMGVNERWLAHHHVKWKTGLPDGNPVPKKGSHTHCSAFVAAVAYRLDIYILRPPQHRQMFLADAQMDWLRTEGITHGWRPVESAKQAQELANKGFLVVAAYKSHKPKSPGHIAIVRPAVKSDEELREEGPQVIQAGLENSAGISLREGFRHHKGAFENGEIRFFAHAVSPEHLRKFGLQIYAQAMLGPRRLQ